MRQPLIVEMLLEEIEAAHDDDIRIKAVHMRPELWATFADKYGDGDWYFVYDHESKRMRAQFHGVWLQPDRSLSPDDPVRVIEHVR